MKLQGLIQSDEFGKGQDCHGVRSVINTEPLFRFMAGSSTGDCALGGSQENGEKIALPTCIDQRLLTSCQ